MKNSLLIANMLMLFLAIILGLVTYYFAITFMLNGHIALGFSFVVFQTFIFYINIYKPLIVGWKNYKKSKEVGR